MAIHWRHDQHQPIRRLRLVHLQTAFRREQRRIVILAWLQTIGWLALVAGEVWLVSRM